MSKVQWRPMSELPAYDGSSQTIVVAFARGGYAYPKLAIYNQEALRQENGPLFSPQAIAWCYERELGVPLSRAHVCRTRPKAGEVWEEPGGCRWICDGVDMHPADSAWSVVDVDEFMCSAHPDSKCILEARSNG